MKILRIEAKDFRRIRRLEVELGPGVNVLHGPNDLGKSTLAETLRAAFLVPYGSTEAKGYAPWGAGGGSDGRRPLRRRRA